MKEIFRDKPGQKPQRPNHYISTVVYATAKGFDPNRIIENERTTWNCPITYPLDGVRRALTVLGEPEAKIPHHILFPPGSTHNSVEAEIWCRIKQEGQLLRVEFKLKNGAKFEDLEKTCLPDALLTDASELAHHKENNPPASWLKKSAKGTRKRRRRYPYPAPGSRQPKPKRPKQSTELPRRPATVSRKLPPLGRGAVSEDSAGPNRPGSRSEAGGETLGSAPLSSGRMPLSSMLQPEDSTNPPAENDSTTDSAEEEEEQYGIPSHGTM